MPTSVLTFKAQDNISQTMKTMTENTKNFAKGTEDAKKKLESLTKEKYKLQLDVASAKKELSEAEKEFKKAGDSAEALEKVVAKNMAWKDAKNNVADVTKQIKDLEKSMRSAGEASEDAGNKISGSLSGGTGTLSAVAGAMGLSDMAKEIGSNVGQFAIGSAFGDAAGDVIGSAISGAITGAMAGSVIPGIGTAVGAALGGAVGTISGLVGELNSYDDAFQEYRNNIYDTVTENYNNTLTNGMDRASQRTKDLIALTNLTGNDATAKSLQQQAISFGRTPPFSYDFAMSAYRNMLGLGIDTDTGNARLNGLANAASALGWSESQASTLYNTLENAEINNTISSRLFKQLSTLGVNGYSALGLDGLSDEQVDAALDSMNADEVVTKIYEYLGEKFAGAADDLTATYEGALGQRDSYVEDLEAARAQGYQDARVNNLNEQSGLYEQYANQFAEQEKILGEGQAYLDNLQDTMNQQAQLIVQGAMLVSDSEFAGTGSAGDLQELQNQFKGLSEDYANATSDEEKGKIAAQMGSCLQQAEAIAADEFNASDIEQAFVQSAIDTASAITEDASVNSSYWNAGYRMGQEMTKGFMSGYNPRIQGIAGDVGSAAVDGVDAFGLYTVPYDGFTAMLHEGERVLTANQARQLDHQGGMGNVTINISEMAVREEADVDRIASELYRKMKLAQLTA